MVRGGFKWSRQNYYRFMRENGQSIADAMVDKANDIVNDADAGLQGATGEDFRIDVELVSGRRRVPRVGILAASYEAQAAEAEKRVLTRAVEANRG